MRVKKEKKNHNRPCSRIWPRSDWLTALNPQTASLLSPPPALPDCVVFLSVIPLRRSPGPPRCPRGTSASGLARTLWWVTVEAPSLPALKLRTWSLGLVGALRVRVTQPRSPESVCLSLRFIICTAPCWLTSASLWKKFLCLLVSFSRQWKRVLFFFIFFTRRYLDSPTLHIWSQFHGRLSLGRCGWRVLRIIQARLHPFFRPHGLRHGGK